MWGTGTATAIGRSFDTYLRDAARFARMRALLGRFVSPGSLAFDVGAHVGDRTLCLDGLGARVVALEPQPAPFRALRLLCRHRHGIVVLPVAAGRSRRRAPMFLNAANPTASSLSAEFVASARSDPGWRGERWHGQTSVEITTLDALIDRYGRPDFVKIDVEGYEAEVLAGLSCPVAALSFEVTSLGAGAALACLDRVEALGDYRFNLGLGETHLLRHDQWVRASVLRRDIERMTHAENSGDVYAVLSGRR